MKVYISQREREAQKQWRRATAAVIASAVLLTVICIVCGCSGVTMNAQYSQLLDRTAALSAETAARAEQGKLTEAQKTAALSAQAMTWQMFRDARDGKATTPVATACTTQGCSDPVMP